MSSTGISIGATAIAAEAYSKGSLAHKLACGTFMKDFQHQGSTVAEQAQYAECFDVLNKTPISDGVILIIKIALALCILCGVFGSVNECRHRFSLSDAAYGFLVGFAIPLIGGGFIAVIVSAIMFIFS